MRATLSIHRELKDHRFASWEWHNRMDFALIVNQSTVSIRPLNLAVLPFYVGLTL